ncbi:Opi1-domain-containing protein [Rickenella mellea]|uniref:Opi1-domain-containing protein n=1 Tax=Rickenella mellea TaxID=50990 RepID=A0A4Y7QAJ5_9AGAM|nr:Opi1-domain-containing protein [Rickenella mellea]
MATASPQAGSSHPPTFSRPRAITDDDDESVMIAVRALDDMRSRPVTSGTHFPPYQLNTSTQPTPALSIASTATSPSISSHHFLSDDVTSPGLVSRVSGLPLVNTALRAYEQSKASSRMVKYGAEMMESSVKSISRPVIDRLPVNQLDEFACRQLDRLGRYGKSGQDEESPHRRSTSTERGRSSWDQGSHMHTRDQSLASTTSSREPSLTRSDDERGSTVEDQVQQQQQDVAARSRWQALLLEAGGIGAAVSEESMRRLKYCLQWLQYATEHIDAQILVLRNFMASLSQRGDDPEEQLVTASHLQTLTDIKRDVVNTIRQVVDVVSKYAGGALPEPARARVRQFILHLPQRWASNQTHSRNPSLDIEAQLLPQSPQSPQSTPSAEQQSSRRQSTSDTTAPPLLPSGEPGEGGILPPMAVLPPPEQVRAGVARPTARAATQAAQKILTLATESLDMMRSVTGVFKESLDRAEGWIERLRIVGIQRQQQQQQQNQHQYREHRRVDSVSDTENPPTPSTGGYSSSALRSSGADSGGFTTSPSPPMTGDSNAPWPYNAPSPAGQTAMTLGALSLSSAYAAAGVGTGYGSGKRRRGDEDGIPVAVVGVDEDEDDDEDQDSVRRGGDDADREVGGDEKRRSGGVWRGRYRSVSPPHTHTISPQMSPASPPPPAAPAQMSPRRNLKRGRDTREDREEEEERKGISAIRGTVGDERKRRASGMDVDDD